MSDIVPITHRSDWQICHCNAIIPLPCDLLRARFRTLDNRICLEVIRRENKNERKRIYYYILLLLFIAFTRQTQDHKTTTSTASEQHAHPISNNKRFEIHCSHTHRGRYLFFLYSKMCCWLCSRRRRRSLPPPPPSPCNICFFSLCSHSFLINVRRYAFHSLFVMLMCVWCCSCCRLHTPIDLHEPHCMHRLA